MHDGLTVEKSYPGLTKEVIPPKFVSLDRGFNYKTNVLGMWTTSGMLC